MICKKVTRFLLISMITVFAVFSSAPPAKADTIQAHGTVSTSYGSYTWSAQQAASTLPITVSLPHVGISFAYNSGTSFSIDYSLKNQYSGIVSITVTGNNTWSVDNVNILTSGCNLDSLPSDHATYKTSHTFNLRLKNSDKFSFVIYGAGATVFLGSTSVSVAHNMSVDNIEQQIDSTLDLYLPGMSTSLSGLGYDSNTSTSLTADTLAYDISIIKNYIDGIEGYLSAGNSYIDQLEGYVDNLENQLANMISLFNINNVYLDRILDTGNVEFWQIAGNIWGYNLSNGSNPQVLYHTLKTFLVHPNAAPNNNTYDASNLFVINPGKRLIFVFYTSLNFSGVPDGFNIVINSAQSGYSSNLVVNKYISISSQRIGSAGNYLNYVTIDNTSSIDLAFEFEIYLSWLSDTYISPVYAGYDANMPDSVSELIGASYNNTYTELLQQIVNGIGNISQQQIIENNTNINNYNNYQTQINNVENNYYNEYNTYNTDIQNNNTFDFSGLSSDGVTVYHNLFTSVFQIDLIKWPLLIILLGLIVVIILG